MGQNAKRLTGHAGAGEAEVFDRAHLSRYTMDSAELEREIIGLFLIQLPATLDVLGGCRSAEEWRMATHTLKGAAAAVGAWKINKLADCLEAKTFRSGEAFAAAELMELTIAIEEFKYMAARHLRG